LERASGVAADLEIGAAVNAVRFALAALLGMGVMVVGQSRPTRREWMGALAIGAPATIGMTLQVVGLLWVLPSTSGILTALPVIFVPLIQAFVLRRAVGLPVWLAALAALAGVVILAVRGSSAATMASQIGPPPFPFAGEILTVLAAAMFCAQILALDRWGRGADVRSLTALLFVVQTAISLAPVLALGHGTVLLKGLAAAATDGAWMLNIGVLAFLSVAGAAYLMNACQPLVPPAHATVIYCLEPVFALLASLAFGQESLTMMTCVGGAVVIGAALTVSLAPGNGKRKGSVDGCPNPSQQR
jgi:drug/metabolite transporter (DMT)-like permease